MEIQYRPPVWLRNPHVNTISTNLLRTVKGIEYERRRLELEDGDFLDLDFVAKGSKTVLLVLHGLEGDSQRHYMLGTVKMASKMGWDAVAMNHRGCGGEDNRKLYAYHSGKSEDLAEALQYLCGLGYEQVVVVGFSLGGNMVLKYMGEHGPSVPAQLKAAVAISVPCHLESSAFQLRKGFNRLYMRRFMKTLKAKALLKKQKFPDAPFDLEEVHRAQSFHEFDEIFTSRVNGFSSAEDYWTRCSSKQFLPGIAKPTLLINAKDDPFLDPLCFPTEEAANNEHFYLETPQFGGHVGFGSGFSMKGPFYSEQVAGKFLERFV